MASKITSRFFAGTYYGQQDFKRMITDGLSSGYVLGVGDNLVVTATGNNMDVSVGIGRGYLAGYSFDVEDGAYTLTVPAAGTSTRYDRVVAHLDEDTGITLIIKTGNANPPSLTRSGKIYEISLAKIKVAAGVGTIKQADITDERGNPAVCGIVGPHVGTLPLASTSQVGGVQVDTSNGLTISNAGVLGYDGIARTIYIDVGDETAPSTQTVVGSISGGGTRVSDSSVHSGSGSGTISGEVSVSIAPAPTAKLYTGLVANRIIERPRVVSCKITASVAGGAIIIGKQTGGRELLNQTIYPPESPKTFEISIPSDWDYSTDKMHIAMWGNQGSSQISWQILPDAPEERLAYWQYPEGAEVPVIPEQVSQTDIDQDDLIAKIIEKIGGI